MARFKTGMVFGVFDGLHEGHKYFLESAKELCVTLIVVVAQDSTSRALKGRLPTHSLSARMRALEMLSPEYKIIFGDEKAGEWSVITQHAPEIVFLGHDQTVISDELQKRSVPFLFLEAHQPEKFKSSLLGKMKPKHEADS
jgi:cytidyltransferase-like protein